MEVNILYMDHMGNDISGLNSAQFLAFVVMIMQKTVKNCLKNPTVSWRQNLSG
jgi:hypothetical protein